MAGYKRHRGGDSWELTVTLGTDFTGKRKRFTKTVHCKNERAAERELSRFLVDCEDGNFNASKPTTVEALSILYMEECVKLYHKRNTQESTQQIINKWITPFLGRRKISAVKKIDIQQWVNMMVKQKKSPKTVNNNYTVMKKMFDYAVEVDLLAKTPCDHIRLPKNKKKEAKTYMINDVEKILKGLDALPKDQQIFKCYILLSLFGGFRHGELLGFDWDHVDFDSHEINVEQTRYWSDEGELFIDSPKSENSIRTVTLPEFVIKELKKLKSIQIEQSFQLLDSYKSNPAIFKMEDGSCMPDKKAYYWFQTFCKHNNLPFSGIHRLRHTHASLLANLGSDMVQVSNRLGHSKLSTTLNIYTHMFENKDTSMAEKLDLFAESKKSKAESLASSTSV